MPPKDEGLDVGDRIRVELIGTDVERGFNDFSRAGWRQGDEGGLFVIVLIKVFPSFTATLQKN